MILEIEEKQKENVDSTQVAIYSIAKFFEGERGHYAEIDKFEDEWEDSLLDPAEDQSTELGKIAHRPRQGTLNTYPGSTAAYGLVGYYMQENLLKKEKKDGIN